jgi:WD40 repeat protein
MFRDDQISFKKKFYHSNSIQFNLNRNSLNLSLPPFADTCRIARNSLTLIANAKPKTFILTIVKEIKRINASSGQSGHHTSHNINTQSNYLFTSALTRGKPELLQIIEKLIDTQAQDVFELFSDVIEIILFCIDPNSLRTTSLDELFPPMFRFSMIRYCKETKRIICGCHNGRLVVYEYKNSKWNFQSYPAHNGQPVVAVAVSSDSKYVASYSAHDNSLIFWQVSYYIYSCIYQFLFCFIFLIIF